MKRSVNIDDLQYILKCKLYVGMHVHQIKQICSVDQNVNHFETYQCEGWYYIG